MRLKEIVCPEGHELGNITYKAELIKDDHNHKPSPRRLVRKIIDDVFYCYTCKKFYKFIVVEAEFTPRKTVEKEGITK